MSFNIRYGTAEDGDDSWMHRSAMVADVIRTREPDVVGLQEAMLFQVAELAAALPEYGHTGRSREADENTGEATPIFYDTRRWRLDRNDTGTFWLSEAPDVPGSTSWGNTLPRICTWARLIDRESSRGIYVFNVHFDHQSANSRAKSAELVARRVAARKYADPVVVLGDFNAEPGSEPLEALLNGEVPLVDAYAAHASGDGDSGTYHAFSGDRSGRRIDYVLVQPQAEITAASIVYDNVDGAYPSDHFPVSASIVVPIE